MASGYTAQEVLQAYENHPLSLTSIRHRLQDAIRLGLPLRELDLAVDVGSGITDQNHIGGALSTLHLALRAGVTASDRILDMGCGLGGPARLLAEVFGCTVQGLDINPRRIEQARGLTELVGLQDRVAFSCSDILTAPSDRLYTVAWAQNSWIHIDKALPLAHAAARALLPAGRIAFEDVFMRRATVGIAEGRQLSVLCDAWRSSFSSVDTWRNGFEDAGFRIVHDEMLDESLQASLDRNLALANANPEHYPALEVGGWRAAQSLTRAGVIGYGRLTGRLT